jgi:predicted transcriptional regulator
MSPRAAWRLESLGFAKVYDYVAGKADWGAAGLPLGGTAGPYAGEPARVDVPTCRLNDRLADVRAQVARSGWDTCIVVNDQNVVLGRLGQRALQASDDVTVEQAMSAGPGTIRPNVELATVTQRLRDKNLSSALVTRSDGTLVGLLRRDDAEQALVDIVNES